MLIRTFRRSMVMKARQFFAVVKRSPLESAFVAVLLVAISLVTLPNIQVDARVNEQAELRATELAVDAMQNVTRETGHLPLARLRGPYYVKTVTATAYNSVPWQTDSTPFTTASGATVRHGIVAANFLPIGTKLTIPEIYGDQIFEVQDRMNPRYYERLDIWMAEVADAKRFGKRQITIHVYP